MSHLFIWTMQWDLISCGTAHGGFPVLFTYGFSPCIMSTGWHHPNLFFFFAKANGTLRPPGPVEEREKGVLRSRQHSGLGPVSTFMLGTMDPEWSDIIGLKIFYSPAGPNTINHNFRHMQGLWRIDWTPILKRQSKKVVVFLEKCQVGIYETISINIKLLNVDLTQQPLKLYIISYSLLCVYFSNFFKTCKLLVKIKTL